MSRNRYFQRLTCGLVFSLLGACGASGPENVRDPSTPKESSESGRPSPPTTVEIPDAPAENKSVVDTPPNSEAPEVAEITSRPAPGDVEGGVEGGFEGGMVGGVVGSSTPLPASQPHNGTIKPDEPTPFGTGMTRPVQISGPPVNQGLVGVTPGNWVARCIIKEDGSVVECRVIRGMPGIDDQLVRNLQAQKYTPVTYQGKPQRVYYSFVIRFR